MILTQLNHVIFIHTRLERPFVFKSVCWTDFAKVEEKEDNRKIMHFHSYNQPHTHTNTTDKKIWRDLLLKFLISNNRANAKDVHCLLGNV